MSNPFARPILQPTGLAEFLFASGVVPLVLAREFVRNVPTWSFALAPSWSIDQLGIFVAAGAILGLRSGRPATGLVAVTVGSLLGLGADLWWLTGFVKPEDQEFVTLLPQGEWRTRLALAALALLGCVSLGFSVAALVRRLWHRSARALLAPSRRGVAALGLAAVGGPLLAVGMAALAASSALVVPDGSQIQTVQFSAGQIGIEPARLRPGESRFRCEYGADASSAGALLFAVPEGAEPTDISLAGDLWYSAVCNFANGAEAPWGSVADLRPGRYAWLQIDNSGLQWRLVASSPAFLVTPD